jgi:hypothetical protein
VPDTNQQIREHWGYREEPSGDGSRYDPNVAPIFDHNTAAQRVKAGMKSSNPIPFCVIHHGQQANGTSCAQTPFPSGRSYLVLDDILPPSAEDVINNIREQSDDDDDDARHPNPRSFPTMKTGFRKSEWKLPKRIIRQQPYLEVI